MAHVETRTASRPSAKAKTRGQIIAEAAGDPALAAPALAQLATQQAGEPTTFAQAEAAMWAANASFLAAWEALNEAQSGSDDAAVARAERAEQAALRARRVAISDFLEHPATTLEEAVQKLDAVAKIDRFKINRRSITGDPVEDYVGPLLVAAKADMLRLAAKPTPPHANYLTHPGLQGYGALVREGAELAEDDEVEAYADLETAFVYEQIFDVPARSAADVLAKLVAYVRYFSGRDGDPTDPAYLDGLSSGGSNGWAHHDTATLVEIILELSRFPLVGGGEAPAADAEAIIGAAQEPDRTAWDAARAAYEAADERLNELADAHSAAEDAAYEDAQIPEELWITRYGARNGFYSGEASIEADATLTFDEKVEKMAAYRAWAPIREAARSKHNVAEREAEYEAAGEALSAAQEALWKTPAPTAEAIRCKLALHIDNYQLHNLGGPLNVHTPEGLSCLLTSEDCADREIGLIYRDLVALTDPASPVAAAEPFDANAWIDEFERHPGHVVDDTGPAFIEPHAFPDGVFGDAPPPGRAQWEALDDWQKKAVRAAGRHLHGVRRIVKDIVMTYANSWNTREEVADHMDIRHPKATAQQMRDAWDQVDAMEDVVFGLTKEEADARKGTRWLVAWRHGGGQAWIDKATGDLVFGCPPEGLNPDMAYLRDDVTRREDLKAAVKDALQQAEG